MYDFDNQIMIQGLRMVLKTAPPKYPSLVIFDWVNSTLDIYRFKKIGSDNDSLEEQNLMME